MERPTPARGDRIVLYWLPLGAGGHVVRLSGRVYERWMAARERRSPCALVHAALEVHSAGERYVIEVAPVWDRRAPDRGVVAEGSVGHPWLGRSKWFRYEVRRWRDGVIPDLFYAVGEPRDLGTGRGQAAAVLDVLAGVPTPTWGRDELGTGDMWNSNAVIAWALSGGGIDAGAIALPVGARAPGWSAGLVVAARGNHAGVGRHQASTRLA